MLESSFLKHTSEAFEASGLILNLPVVNNNRFESATPLAYQYLRTTHLYSGK